MKSLPIEPKQQANSDKVSDQPAERVVGQFGIVNRGNGGIELGQGKTQAKNEAINKYAHPGQNSQVSGGVV